MIRTQAGVLSARGIGAVAAGRTLLADVSLEIGRGECVCLCSEDDQARSTLLQILATRMAPASGALLIDGLDVSTHLLEARRRVAYASLAALSAPGMRVGEYVALISRARGGAAMPLEGWALASLRYARVSPDAWIERLSPCAHAATAIAAALATGAPLLILDDVTEALDAEVRGAFIALLSDVNRAGTTVVIGARDSEGSAPASRRLLRVGAQQVEPAAHGTWR